jgi:hypothetical protein
MHSTTECQQPFIPKNPAKKRHFHQLREPGQGPGRQHTQSARLGPVRGVCGALVVIHVGAATRRAAAAVALSNYVGLLDRADNRAAKRVRKGTVPKRAIRSGRGRKKLLNEETCLADAKLATFWLEAESHHVILHEVVKDWLLRLDSNQQPSG